MSMCINDDLIWVSIPRCASISIEAAFTNSNLNKKYYKKSMFFDKGIHLHLQLKTLHSYFGLKESVCIKRNFVDRWLSGLEHFWWSMEFENLTPIIPFDEIDNDFLYNNFTNEYIDNLHIYDPLFIGDDGNIDFEYNNLKTELNHKFAKEKSKRIKSFLPLLLLSTKFWTNNKTCTYEFEFNNLNLFEEFISDRYDIEFKIPHLNSREKVKSKIIKNDKLENWIWENFEKRFQKLNKTII